MNTLADQWMRQGWDADKIEGKVEGVRSTILDQILAISLCSPCAPW